jgi:glucose-6-phosphate 1-dehydrogenase
MSAKDVFHDAVKSALQKDGWQVDDKQLRVTWEEVELYIDLSAERLLAANRGSDKIAVEVKSFLENSTLYSFHSAVGQFISYRTALREQEGDRILYLGVPQDIYDTFFRQPFTQAVIQENHVRLIVYNPEKEEIVLWTD